MSDIEKKTPVQNEEVKKKKKSAKALALEFFIKIGITVVVIWAICTFVIDINIVHNNSNYPMIKDGDLCITYRLATLHNGDFVEYVTEDGKHFGRIVAEAGDTINVGEDGLTVNGYGVFEDSVYPTTGEGASIDFPYTVPSDSEFLLNDYRADMSDSRTVGAVSRSDIKGKVVFVMRRRGI